MLLFYRNFMLISFDIMGSFCHFDKCVYQRFWLIAHEAVCSQFALLAKMSHFSLSTPEIPILSRQSGNIAVICAVNLYSSKRDTFWHFWRRVRCNFLCGRRNYNKRYYFLRSYKNMLVIVVGIVAVVDLKAS